MVSARRIFAAAVALFAVVCFTGCGDADGQLRVYPVRGQVLYRGQPAAGAVVSFHPISEELKAAGLIISGRVADDGSYQLMTYEEGDGAPAGEYRVSILWRQPEPGQPDPNEEVDHSGPDRLGGKYQDPAKSGLKATVTDEANNIPTFKLE